MAESIPILTHSDSIEQETPIPSLDNMIEQSLGDYGWTQFLQSLLVCLAMFFDAQQTFISIFTDSHPKWHCVNHTICTSHSYKCKLPKSSWAWDDLSSKTIIYEWGLHCSTSFITGLPQSSFFMGCFLAGFLLSTFADSSLGRKNMLFFSCLTMSIASFLIIFSTNVWIYSAFKFLIGFFRSSIATSSLVLATEKVGKEWRFRVGILQYLCFTIGFLSWPGIAYVNRSSSWKSLYFWTSIPSISYSIFAYLFVTESPRWLLMQGREEEAMAILEGSSRNNLPARLLEVPMKQKKASTFYLYSSMRELIAKNWAIQRLLAVMVLGFGIGMVYFGMPLDVGNLGFNAYSAVIFNASLEIPSYIVTYFLENCRRKPTMLGFSMASGVCSIICVLIGNNNEVQGGKLGLALASFFCACVAGNVFILYAIEVFPTSVRSTATSLVRQAIVFGAIFSPFFISEGRKNDIFSYGVFGVVISCSAFSVIYLPETKGIALCDTMDEQEKK